MIGRWCHGVLATCLADKIIQHLILLSLPISLPFVNESLRKIMETFSIEYLEDGQNQSLERVPENPENKIDRNSWRISKGLLGESRVQIYTNVWRKRICFNGLWSNFWKNQEIIGRTRNPWWNHRITPAGISGKCSGSVFEEFPEVIHGVHIENIFEGFRCDFMTHHGKPLEQPKEWSVEEFRKTFPVGYLGDF